MYWAGPRGFVATMRHFDFEAIKILEEEYLWIVHDPFRLVSDVLDKQNMAANLGRNGIIRKICLKYVEAFSQFYTGLIWDTGTAREVEYAISRDKPVLAWSDSSVFFGEIFEEKNGTIDGKKVNDLFVKALPFNAMDIVFDRYLKLNQPYNCDLNEHALAEKIDKEAREILNSRLQGISQ